MPDRSDERSRARERYAVATPDRRYSALFQNLKHGIAHCRVITDRNGRPIDYEILEVNHAYELITGLKKSEVEGKLATEVFPGIEHAAFDYIGTYGKVALEGGEASFEIFFEFLQRWLSVFVYTPAKGEFVVLFNDISDRKRAEEALRGSEERLMLALEAGRVGTFEYNPRTRALFMGERMRALWSVPPEAKVTYEDMIALVHPDDRERVNQAIASALQPDSAGRYEAEYRVVWPDGSVHWGVGRGRAFFEGEGSERKAARMVGVHFDITERKRAEEALRETEERYRTVFDRAAIGMGRVRFSDARWLEVNDAFARMLGYTREELQGIPWPEITHPEDIDLDLIPFRRMAAGEIESYTVEKRFIHKLGHPIWARLTLSLVRDPAGKPDYEIAVIEDITARKEAAEQLRRSEREFRNLANSMPQLVWTADGSGAITYVNRQFQERMGLPEDMPLGQAWKQLLHPEDRDRVDRIWRECVATGQPYETEYRLRVRGGAYRWFLARAVPIRDDEGRITRWYGTSTDIDESKRAEELLRQAQKLESIGLLAGGIAHDFNNLLTGIIGNASLALDEGAGPAAAQRMREVIRAAERGANLTRQLLAYSGKGQFIVSDVDVSQAVSEIADLVQFSIPKSVELVLNVRRRLPVVQMDPSQLQQVLMNLVINAGEAIGEGNPGTVTVSTSVAQFDEPFVDAIGQEVKPGRYVRIEVSDTGSGINQEQKSKIFDPFYTTKFTGRGLGLSAVAGIVRMQKGGIVVESEPGRGTTFNVYLPVAETGGETAEDESAVNGRKTVLVIDDDEDVRNVIGTVLRREGYRVLLAASGAAALAISRREELTIHAVVLDIMMPAICAKDVLPELTARRPDIRILLTTGYSEAEVRRLCAAYPGAEFIRKPYTAQQIAAKLKRLLEKR